MNPVPAEQIVEELRELVKKHPSDKAATKAIKCTPSQLSCTLNGRNNVIPDRILKALGYTAQLAYFKIGDAPKAKAKKAKKAAAVKKPAAKPALRKKVVELPGVSVAQAVAQRNVGVRRIGANDAVRNENAGNEPTTHISIKG